MDGVGALGSSCQMVLEGMGEGILGKVQLACDVKEYPDYRGERKRSQGRSSWKTQAWKKWEPEPSVQWEEG